MANPIANAELKKIRGYGGPAHTGYAIPDLRKIQQMNKNAVDTLKDARYLGLNWELLRTVVSGGKTDGFKLAKEMTNRINDPANASKEQLYCDARQWVNAEPSIAGVKRPIEDNEGYYLYVNYNATGGGANHFFNFMMEIDRRRIVRDQPAMTADTERVQLAHLTIFTDVEEVVAGKNPSSYTKLGFMHLKDDLSIGKVTSAPRAPVILDPRYPTRHIAVRRGQIFNNYRRYFIYIQKDAAGNPTRFIIGLQHQDGPVSRMAISFNLIAVNVLQEYFDAGFATDGFITPQTNDSFRAYGKCSLVDVYVNNGDQTTLPFVGGKRKTRRGQKNRKQTRKSKSKIRA